MMHSIISYFDIVVPYWIAAIAMFIMLFLTIANERRVYREGYRDGMADAYEEMTPDITDDETQ